MDILTQDRATLQQLVALAEKWRPLLFSTKMITRLGDQIHRL